MMDSTEMILREAKKRSIPGRPCAVHRAATRLETYSSAGCLTCAPCASCPAGQQPKQIKEIKDFLLTARRKDASSVKIKKAPGVTKFKVLARSLFPLTLTVPAPPCPAPLKARVQQSYRLLLKD
jgi:hypothetical protein